MAFSKTDWLIVAGLVALGLVPAMAGSVRLASLAAGAEVTSENARFVASPVPVVLHIVSVVIFSLLGALQFAPGFRRARPGWHRVAGRILVPAGLMAALTGLWMAQFYRLPATDGAALYLMRLAVGSAMLLALVLGLVAIRRRDFAAHEAWMMRAYGLGMGAGTQVITHLPWMLTVGLPDTATRAVLMGAAWAINVAVVEWVLGQTGRRGQPRRAAPVGGRSFPYPAGRRPRDGITMAGNG